MSIDIPRIQPVVTPPESSDDEELRVRRTTRGPRIPARLPHPEQDRRSNPDRRRSSRQRRDGFELRDGGERRTRIDVDA